MTLDLIQIFEGKQIRVIDQDNDHWIPVPDLAMVWGIDRTTPAKIIARNPEVFEDLSQYCDVTSPPGECVLCVNERGLYLLMGKISAGRLKNDAAREAIIRFQRWVPELIQSYRKKEIAQVAPAVQTIEAELQRARMLATETGGDLKAFQAVALKKCGMPEYVEALNVPALIHGEAGTWFNATQLGDQCGLNAREVNSWLYNRGWQYPEGPVWRIQPKACEHGEEYWFEATSGHREIRIRWKESILYASGLKRQESEPTALLPARA